MSIKGFLDGINKHINSLIIMKDNRSKQMPISAIIAILVAIIIVVLTQYYNGEFPLQYMENGEMKTEVFNSPKEYNKRAKELQADSIKYWLDLHK